jgi:hypothetical protein
MKTSHVKPINAVIVAVATPCCPRAGLGDDTLLAHALGEQSLAERVVDLVRAGMTQVFTLEVDLRAAQVLAEPPRVIQRRGTADVLPVELGELGLEFPVVLPTTVGLGQLEHRGHERLGNETPAELSEASVSVRQRCAWHVR